MVSDKLNVKEKIYYMIFTLFKKNVRDFSTIYSVIENRIGKDSLSLPHKETIRKYVKDMQELINSSIDEESLNTKNTKSVSREKKVIFTSTDIEIKEESQSQTLNNNEVNIYEAEQFDIKSSANIIIDKKNTIEKKIYDSLNDKDRVSPFLSDLENPYQKEFWLNEKNRTEEERIKDGYHPLKVEVVERANFFMCDKIYYKEMQNNGEPINVHDVYKGYLCREGLIGSGTRGGIFYAIESTKKDILKNVDIKEDLLDYQIDTIIKSWSIDDYSMLRLRVQSYDEIYRNRLKEFPSLEELRTVPFHQIKAILQNIDYSVWESRDESIDEKILELIRERIVMEKPYGENIGLNDAPHEHFTIIEQNIELARKASFIYRYNDLGVSTELSEAILKTSNSVNNYNIVITNKKRMYLFNELIKKYDFIKDSELSKSSIIKNPFNIKNIRQIAKEDEYQNISNRIYDSKSMLIRNEKQMKSNLAYRRKYGNIIER